MPSIKSGASSVLSGFKSLGSGAQKVASNIKTAFSNVGSKIKSVASNISSAADSITSKLFNIKSLVAGVATGAVVQQSVGIVVDRHPKKLQYAQQQEQPRIFFRIAPIHLEIGGIC